MKKRKANKIKKDNWDAYDSLGKDFEKIDKIIIEILGKPCPEFAPLCPVCKGYLIYNKFKNDMYKEYT